MLTGMRPRTIVLALGCTWLPAAAQAATATAKVIFEFANLSLGGQPQGGVVADAQGRLYGTTYEGGAFNYGTVWRLDPPQSPGGAWIEEILHSFGPTSAEGAQPSTPVTLGSDGSIYGSTPFGGPERGMAYKLANQPGWPITVLHDFVKGSGEGPNSGMVFGPFGLLYGSDSGGYGNQLGVDYSLSPLGDSVEYNTISTAAQIGSPNGLTAVPNKSQLVGFTQPTVTAPATFYSVSMFSSGHGHTTTQYVFGPPPDVNNPITPPLVGSGALAGSAFGCGFNGGTNGHGGIYQVTRTASSAVSESVIFNFPDSQYPNAIPFLTCALVQGDTTGTIYGVTGGNLTGVKPLNDFLELTPPAVPGGTWGEQSLLYFFADNPINPTRPSYPMARVGNKYYLAFGQSDTNDRGGAIVEITVTP